MKNFNHLFLADLTYSNQFLDSTIDLLIGAEYYAALLDTKENVILGSPAAIPTRFGWLLVGKMTGNDDRSSLKHQSFFVEDSSSELRKFWELEEGHYEKPVNPEDILCEQHFVETFQRDATGRYFVNLPFKNLVAPDLGSNRDVALKRLKGLDLKLNKDPQYKSLS